MLRHSMAVIALGAIVAISTAAMAQSELAGEYSGSYRCAQGMTSLRLILSDDGRHGRFVFSAGGVRGSYLFTVQPAGNGEYLLVPQRWEQRPTGFQMVPARVSFTGDRVEGEIEAPSCGDLTARRVGRAKASSTQGTAGSSPAPPRGRADLLSMPRAGSGISPSSRPGRASTNASLFLPGNKDRLEEYLIERATGTKAMLRSCLHKMETRYSSGSRPLPAAEQIRRNNESSAMLADCNEQSKADFAGVLDEFRQSVSEWARQQPATYDGLRALRAAEVEYRAIGRFQPHDSIAFAVAAQVKPMIAEVFGQRRAEIEPAVRAALMADVARDGSTQRVTELFYDDPRIVASYRGALNEQRAAATQAAAMKAVPAGSNGEVALAATSAFGRAPRIALGRSLGTTVVAGTAIDVNVVGITEHYEFTARNAQCSAATGGKTSCSYEFNFLVSGTFAGVPLPAQQSGWTHRHDTFVRDGSLLRSASLDRDMATLAEASQSSTGGQSLSDGNAERRRQDCRQSVYSSVMSGDYGAAAATGIAGCQ